VLLVMTNTPISAREAAHKKYIVDMLLKEGIE